MIWSQPIFPISALFPLSSTNPTLYLKEIHVSLEYYHCIYWAFSKCQVLLHILFHAIEKYSQDKYYYFSFQERLSNLPKISHRSEGEQGSNTGLYLYAFSTWACCLLKDTLHFHFFTYTLPLFWNVLSISTCLNPTHSLDPSKMSYTL